MLSHDPSHRAALAADRVSGPMRVIAGPGAGKTHTLVSLYAELVEKKLAGRGEILVLTFSTSAADEIMRRLDERLRDSYDKAWISTFHSFCWRVLRQYGGGRARSQINGFQEWFAMRAVLGELQREPLGAFGSLLGSEVFAQDAVSFVALLKQNLVRPEHFALLAEASGNDRLRSLAVIFRNYQARLAEAGLLDFRDLVSGAIELLHRDGRLLHELQSSFRYVLVDEFQDVDPAQFELLRLIAPPGDDRRLIVFGDPDQSIYGFRGTVPALLREEFAAIYGGEKTLLESSFRCPPSVLGAAQRVLAETQPPEPRLRLEDQAGRAAVQIVQEDNAVEEAFFVAREIKRLVLEEDRRPEDFAILLRSASALGGPFEEALRALELPYEVRGRAAMTRNEVVRFLLAYLRSLAAPDDSPALARVLGSSLSGVGATITGRLQGRAGEEGRPFVKIVRQLMHRLQEHDTERFLLPWGSQDDTAVADMFPEAKEWDVEFLGLDAAVKVHTAMQAWYALRRKARTVPLADLAYELLIDAGVMERLLQAPLLAADRLEALADLRSTVEAFRELDQVASKLHGSRPLLSDLAGSLESLIARAVDETEQAPAARLGVHLLTVHQAKGLEFPVVFVAGFAAGIFPVRERPNPILDEPAQRWLVEALHGFRPSWPVDQAGHLAEEGRLAYVAMTRARDRLYLTYARDYERAVGPSPFLAALGEPDARQGPERPPALGDVLTRTDAETQLARLRAFVDDGDKARLRGLDLDTGFVMDPDSGSTFEPFQVRAAAVDPHHFSATDLTAYLKCPRLYWYTHHPGLSPPAKSAEMERGGFIHRVLEDFHRREAEWRHLPPDAARAWLDAAISAHLEQYLGRIELVIDRRREELEVRRILKNYVDFATSSQRVRRLGTLSTEKKFVLHLDMAGGGGAGAPASSAEIHGKIDRINDTGEGTCEVVDYKTGKGHSANQDYLSYFGEELYDVQLAIYYLACLHGLDENGEPLALQPRFLSVWYPKDRRRDAPIRQVLFTVGKPAGLNQYWERLLTDEDLQRAQRVVANAISGILAGDFAPRPREGVVGTCLSFTGCPHQAICPFARAGVE